MLDQRSHTLHIVGGDQLLLGKNIFQLFVIFVGKRGVMRFFDGHSTFFSLAHTAAAGTIHAIE